ncbi:MAG: symmetrical bis(5'-nucleosyl)-tetraphosphatase [Thermoanaerobaculia bacterium]
MATWVVGDVHGCWRTLERLLARLDLKAGTDRLWLVGDLVNRGPGSLEVLRWARDRQLAMGGRFVVTLGNHDLHLLALDAGVATPRPQDTLGPVLEAPDREELLAWLVECPLLHREGEDVLVHAGLLPSWTLEEAERRARGAETALRAGATRAAMLARPAPADAPGARAALDVLSRLRTCTEEERPCSWSGSPGGAPEGCRPWFGWPHRRGTARVLFGHWAALGLHRSAGAVGLDSGCSWGQELTAFRLEDGAVVQEPLRDAV